MCYNISLDNGIKSLDLVWEVLSVGKFLTRDTWIIPFRVIKCACSNCNQLRYNPTLVETVLKDLAVKAECFG